MQKRANEPTNISITKNENRTQDWALNDFACEIGWWVDFFNIVFFKDQPVPVPALSFEKTRITSFGNYVSRKNSLGIQEYINLNRAHLNRPMWELLATLLHEMTHRWQAIYGKPSKSWFHNKEFQLKMMNFGIVCNSKGCHNGVGGPFVYLLKKHGIIFNFDSDAETDGIIKIPTRAQLKGRSKLKKWSCGCANIRVAVKNFKAKCLTCGNDFEQYS